MLATLLLTRIDTRARERSDSDPATLLLQLVTDDQNSSNLSLRPDALLRAATTTTEAALVQRMPVTCSSWHRVSAAVWPPPRRGVVDCR